MTVPTTPGRRDRKKSATRQLIADRALALFLERGFESVSVREVAAAADVSPTTLLNYFPSKEALVIDRGEEIADDLVQVVSERPREVSILDALEAYGLRRVEAVAGDPKARAFLALVLDNRDLTSYWHETWMHHEEALAQAIRNTSRPEEKDPAEIIAHFALDAIALAIRSPDPKRTLVTAFSIIRHGVTPP